MPRTPFSSTSPVSGSDDSDLRRLGEIVRNAIASIFSTNPFLPRNSVLPPVVLPAQFGAPGKLEWGTLNRVICISTGMQRAQLPQIRAEWVGAPLLVAISQPTGFTVKPSLIPGGFNLLGTQPRVNGSATGTVATGLRTAITDGVDWAVY